MRTLDRPINDLIDEWPDNHDVAPITKQKYRSNVRLWVNYMVQNETQHIKQPKKAHLINYKSFLINKGHTNRTIDGYLAPVKVFFRYLQQENIYENISLGVKAMGGYDGHIKKYLKTDQVVQLLESIDTSTLVGKRDLAMINLMVNTGLRCVEVERLDVGDIKMGDDIWVIRIQGKGQREKNREMGLPSDVSNLIWEYLDYRGVEWNGEPMFTILSGERMKSYLISRHIKERLIAIGINDPKITAHSLRHTAAVMALESRASIHDVQIMLGHKDIKTSMIYLSSIEQEKALTSGAVHRNSETIRKLRKMYKKGRNNGTFQNDT